MSESPLTLQSKMSPPRLSPELLSHQNVGFLKKYIECETAGLNNKCRAEVDAGEYTCSDAANSKVASENLAFSAVSVLLRLSRLLPASISISTVLFYKRAGSDDVDLFVISTRCHLIKDSL